MAEPAQKRRKGQDNTPPADVISIEPQDSLYFITSHPSKPAQVRLEVFATGASMAECAPSQRHRFIPFSGRPILIRELAPYIRKFYGNSPGTTIESLLCALRWWWRHLDQLQQIAPVFRLQDLNDIHYAAYRAAPSAESIALVFFKIVDAARVSQELPQLYWTVIADPERVGDLVSYEDVRRIYHFVKRPAFDTLLRWSADPDAQPTRLEVLYLFTLYILNSGWNAQTAMDIDISNVDERGCLRCITAHPQSESFSYVRSRKTRAGGSIQYALSRNKSVLSPANIIIALYRQTKPLRDRLSRYLNILKWQLKRWHKYGGKTIRQLNDRKELIAEIEREVKSPWLYTRGEWSSGKRFGSPIADVGTLRTYSMGYRRLGMRCPLMIWAKEINSRLKPGEPPIAEDIVLTDLRDAYISWRWERSGYSWLDAMLAAGHRNIETLKRYLNKKQHKDAARRDFLKVGNAMWETITRVRGKNSGSSLPTVISLKVAGASPQQIERWLSDKDQTYVGTGCVDFYNPPQQFNGSRRPGEGCTIQRCTMCEQAVLLPNSHHHLAKRLVELRYYQAEISTTSWLESDYPIELENTKSALSNYDEIKVESSVAYWEEQVRNGSHHLLIFEGYNA